MLSFICYNTSMTENKQTTPKKEIKKENVKNPTTNKKPVKKVKEDYKKLYEDAKKQIDDLNMKLKITVLEKNQDINTFKLKAKGFQDKAQVELNKVKKQLMLKSESDEKEVQKYGSQRLLEGIIDPINNFDLAIQAGKKQDNPSVQAYVQGFDMLLNQLFASFKDNSITVIAPKVGDKFDPKLHMAISKNTNKDINIIAEVKKNGYKLHDRIIKPASVIIGK